MEQGQVSEQREQVSEQREQVLELQVQVLVKQGQALEQREQVLVKQGQVLEPRGQQSAKELEQWWATELERQLEPQRELVLVTNQNHSLPDKVVVRDCKATIGIRFGMDCNRHRWSPNSRVVADPEE